MFEFDEHYRELELLENEPRAFIIEDGAELTAEWHYIDHEIWKMAATLLPLTDIDKLAS